MTSVPDRRLSILLLPFLLFVTAFCTGCATTRLPEQAVPASQSLRQAERERGDAVRAVGLYLDAARQGLALATDQKASAEARAEGERIYNAALTSCALTLKKNDLFPPGKKTALFPGANTTYRLGIAPAQGTTLRDPAQYSRLLDASKIFRKHLGENIIRPGAGATLLGVVATEDENPNRPPGGYALPLTAVASFGPKDKGETPAVLSFYNPQMKDEVTLNGMTEALAADFTAPLAFFPRKHEVVFGFAAMLFSDRIAHREGIYFLEPYDPQKIPILFVHGLMSSPHAWINFVNDLNANPEFRKRYQPWVLFYPSGGPIGGNALRLREHLKDLEKRYPLKRNMVVVGHSMGGLLTQMQVTDSKRVLWDTVFQGNADSLYKKLPETSLVKRALIFKPNPHISEVIFFSVPHRGSRLADMRISALAARLIRMPAKLVHDFNPEMRGVLRDIDPQLRSIPTSILGLSPRNRLLKGLDKVEIEVPYHSVVGNRGKDHQPLAETTDGIVAYWSSHLDGAESELVVPTGHNSFDHPKSIAELLRILGITKGPGSLNPGQ